MLRLQPIGVIASTFCRGCEWWAHDQGSEREVSERSQEPRKGWDGMLVIFKHTSSTQGHLSSSYIRAGPRYEYVMVYFETYHSIQSVF